MSERRPSKGLTDTLWDLALAFVICCIASAAIMLFLLTFVAAMAR